MIFIFCLIIILIAALFINREWRLYRDFIPNTSNDPFLAYAENERKQRKQMFAPWVTKDPNLIAINKNYFPELPLLAVDELKKPPLTPVKIVVNKLPQVDDNTEYFIAVGGPPAAMVAFQQAKNGKRVLYACMQSRPIWAAAANHGEPDVLTEAPAYISGHHPFKFVWEQSKRYFNPPRYQYEVLQDEYPWLTLNIEEWLMHPIQMLMGFRMAWGAYRLDKTSVLATLKKRTNESGKYLETFNTHHARILRDPRGSLLVAPDQITWAILLNDQDKLKNENVLAPLTVEQAYAKYGITFRNAYNIMEKKNDFIFEPDFNTTIINEIKKQGGEVNNWRLTRILIDADNPNKGVFEFCENENTYHFKKFSQAHLSLGSTTYDPNPYDLVSVTGVSINALIFGVKYSGGPLVCGGKGNHVAVAPLVEPRMIDSRPVSYIRIASGGCVGPLNRTASRWYSYSGRTAVNALHCLRKILPLDAELKVLSVIGCNRLIGKDSRQVETNPFVRINGNDMPITSITIQVGAGGGGLTQMGAVPSDLS